MTPPRILRVLTRPNVGGPTRQAAALWHACAAHGASTVLAVGSVGNDEAAFDLAAAGLPQRAISTIDFDTPGVCTVPGLGRSVRGIGDLRALIALARLIRRIRPDVVHTHTSKAGVLGRLAVRLAHPFGHRPLVVHTWHGHVLRDHLPRTGEHLATRIERSLAGFADRHVAVADSVAADLREFGVLGGRNVEVVPPAIDVGPFTALRGANRHPDAPCRLAFVGRLVPVKRPLTFVDVIASARAIAPGTTGVVFGDGPLRPAMRALAHERGVADSIEWRGAVDVPTLACGLADADCLVVPSLREGAPLAVFEAFAVGRPVVGFARPGVEGVLTRAEMTVVAERGDPEGDAENLARAALTAAETGTGTAARQVVEECAPEAVARRLMAIYGWKGN